MKNKVRRTLAVCLGISTMMGNSLMGQSPIASYNTLSSNPVASSNASNGLIGSNGFSSTTSYTHFYGSTASGTGINREILSVTVAGIEYKRAPKEDGKSFDIVQHRKHPSLPGNVINSLFEVSGTSGNNLYYFPEYVNTIDELVNSYFINRGVDNVFSNTASTSSNIERIDLLNLNGVIAQDTERQGFVINERNGNDNIKVAIIKELDTDNNPIAYGPLLTIAMADWGRNGPTISTRVMTRDTLSDPFFRPKENVGAQTVSGVFFSLSNLNLTVGEVFYGFSIFPNDVSDANDLVGLSDFPIDTDGTVNGGADLLAGSGFFSYTPVEISGSVYDDFDTNGDNTLNGTKINMLDEKSIFIHLVDKDLNKVVGRKIINNQGNYEFLNVLDTRNYDVYLSTVPTAIGAPPSSVVLSKYWFKVGENINSVSNTGYDSTADGKVTVSAVSGDILNIDFGLSKQAY